MLAGVIVLFAAVSVVSLAVVGSMVFGVVPEGVRGVGARQGSVEHKGTGGVRCAGPVLA